jgi:glycosyltransferase involved in cell wall biosynthesis
MNLPCNVIVLHESGADRHFEALAWLLHQDNKPIHFCSLNFVKRLVRAVLQRKPGALKSVLHDMIDLGKMLRRTQHTIIIGVAPFSVWIFLIALLRKRNNVIYYSSWHDWAREKVPNHPNVAFLEHLWRRHMRGISAVGVSRVATSELGRFGMNASHIPHSVDTKTFQPSTGKRSAVNVLFVGRLEEAKGVLQILEASREVSRNNINITWTFAGAGRLEASLKAAKDEGLPIRLLGHITGQKLLNAYQEADIFILPSYSIRGWEELFGISIIEAFAHGLPVVATDCVGPKELIENGTNGYLVEQRNVAQLKAAILKLVDDEELRLQMGRNARQRAVEDYDTVAIASLWYQAISKLTGTGAESKI